MYIIITEHLLFSLDTSMERLEWMQLLQNTNTTGIIMRCQRRRLRYVSNRNRKGGVRFTRSIALIWFRSLKYVFAVLPAQWQDWGAWSQCTVSCGQGLKMRARSCFDPESGNNQACSGSSTEVEECNEEECTGTLVVKQQSKRKKYWDILVYCPTQLIITWLNINMT